MKKVSSIRTLVNGCLAVVIITGVVVTQPKDAVKADEPVVVEKIVYQTPPIDQSKYEDVIAYITKRFEKYGKKVVAEAIAISYLESKWDAKATNQNWKNGVVVSTDRGYWQFNDKAHPEVSEACARDLVCSTDQAVKHYEQSGWNPWVASKVTRLFW